jgi:hypothetical protein
MDPDPSIIKQNSKKRLGFYCFVTSLWLFMVSLKNDVNVPSKSTGNEQTIFSVGVI